MFKYGLLLSIIALSPSGAAAGAKIEYGVTPGRYDCVTQRMAGIVPQHHASANDDETLSLRDALKTPRVAGAFDPDQRRFSLSIEQYGLSDRYAKDADSDKNCKLGLRLKLPRSLRAANGGSYAYAYSKNGVLFHSAFTMLLFMGKRDPYAVVSFYASFLQGPWTNYVSEGRCVKFE